MKTALIIKLIEDYKEKTSDVMNMKELSFSEMEETLYETFEVLYAYKSEKDVPKLLCRLLLEIDEYLRISALMGSYDSKLAKEFFVYRAILAFVNSLKEGFFAGEYENPFPFFKVEIENCTCTIDTSKPFLKYLLELPKKN